MKFVLSILTILFLQTSFGQKDYCEVVLNKTFVAQNERFSYQIVTNLECDIILPDFASVGLEIVGGPIQGSNYYNHTTNGVTSKGVEYHLTYYLIATKKGTIAIPPAKVECKNKTITSSLTKINVGEAASENEVQTHFLKATANKKTVYVGEPFIIELKFYSNQRPKEMGPVEPGASSPMFRDNLYKEKQNYTLEEEIIKGEHYYVISMYKEICIPISPGKIEVKPYYASVRIGNDFFNVKWLDGISNKVEIEVKEVPKNQPPNFNGLVGNFTMTHGINKTTLNIGEVIDMEITIEGQGNFNTFDDPELNFPDEFHVFDPEVERDLKIEENGFNGKITYHYIVSPDEVGHYIIPPFSFSYFNLKENKFKSLTTSEFEIQVDQGNGTVIVDSGNRKDPTIDDINDIKYDTPSFFRLSDLFYGSIAYWLLLLTPLVGSSIWIILGLRKKNQSEEDVLANEQKSVKKSVFKEFSVALAQLESGQDKEAIKLTKNALENYFMVKFSLTRSTLSKQQIVSKLKENGIDEKTIKQFEMNWSNIEMAQFSQVNNEGLKSIIQNSENIIKVINQNI